MQTQEVSVKLVNPKDTPLIRGFCPYCNKNTVFQFLDGSQDLLIDLTFLCDEVIYKGIRRCSECEEELCFSSTFSIEQDYDFSGEIITNEKPISLRTLPSNIKFEINKNIPDEISNVFEEAQKCFTSGLCLSSAIMIRKTLEMICYHFKITGKNLEKRIDKLSQLEILKEISIEDLHELRHFGNDAAHINKIRYKEFTEKEILFALKAIKNLLDILFDNKKEEYRKNIEKLRKQQITNQL